MTSSEGMNEGDPGEGDGVPDTGMGRPSAVTLVLIPLLIVIIWIIENYLLAGGSLISAKTGSPGLLLYTVLSCIVVGIIVPLIRIRTAFRAGAVNMFQIGFRSLRRTVATVSLTTLATYTIVLFLRVYGIGPDRETGFFLFAIFLPTAVAAVMICWVLAGTHIQAYVRSGGILISIVTGAVTTALFFGLSMSTLFAGDRVPDLFLGYFAAGIFVALFFFAVRDIYATVFVVAWALVLIAGSVPDFVIPYSLTSAVVFCAILAVAALVIVHWHFSRHYTTVKIPEKP